MSNLTRDISKELPPGKTVGSPSASKVVAKSGYYSVEACVIGLIFESDDQNELYKLRLKTAITEQFQKLHGKDNLRLEFVEAKLNAKYFRRMKADELGDQTYRRAAHELNLVLKYLQSKQAHTIAVASEGLIKYQRSAMDLLGILPCESPDWSNAAYSFATQVYQDEIASNKKNADGRNYANNTISLALIGKQSAVRLICDRETDLQNFSEVRRKYSNLLVRWCVMPSNLRAELNNRLRCFDQKLAIQHDWFVKQLKRLPRIYAKRNVSSKDISPAKIHDIVIADTKTERLLLGLTKQQYREAASRPGEISQRIKNLVQEAYEWPEREVGSGRIAVYSALDLYAKEIAELAYRQAPIATIPVVTKHRVIAVQNGLTSPR